MRQPKTSDPTGARQADRLTDRLWRVRRQHHHIDALVYRAGEDWALRFDRNDRILFVWTFATAGEARGVADAKLRDLQRAGWTLHW